MCSSLKALASRMNDIIKALGRSSVYNKEQNYSKFRSGKKIESILKSLMNGVFVFIKISVKEVKKK